VGHILVDYPPKWDFLAEIPPIFGGDFFRSGWHIVPLSPSPSESENPFVSPKGGSGLGLMNVEYRFVLRDRVVC